MSAVAQRRYEDAVVLITGAASGFGRLAAERFAQEGARLVLGTSRSAGSRKPPLSFAATAQR